MVEQCTAEQVVSTPSIYRHLAAHQTTADGWALRDLFEKLHEWAEVFNLEFKLELSTYTLSVDWVRRSAYGLYRYGHNGLGLEASVTINRHYLGTRPFWQVLGTLLHELLHAWQEKHGKPGSGNYHNKEFREKALGLGLMVATNGYTQYLPDSAFTRLLAERGVMLPDLTEPVPTVKQKGESKLKKWSCRCTNVRVARKDFWATCNNCGYCFEACD